MSIQYFGGPKNLVFDTQNTLAQLKCMMDDLQAIVNKILPGSVPITESGSNSTSTITLPIQATQITWSDPNTGNKLTIQQALQSINSHINLIELYGSGSGLGSCSGLGSGSGLEVELSGTEIPATQVTCFDGHNV
jgi:hypothetical protein